MKPDILLVQAPVWGINMPPMSLAYLSRYLRTKNIKTEIEDLNIKEYHRTKKTEYWSNEKADCWMIIPTTQRATNDIEIRMTLLRFVSFNFLNIIPLS